MALSLSKKELTILKKFKSALNKEIGKNMFEIKLFGSKARGDSKKDSDIDILVITSSDDWRLSDIVYDIATDILLEDEICISPKVISKSIYDNLNHIKTPFIKNIEKDAIAI